MFGGFVELGGVRAAEIADVAREFDGGDLHAEADAEIRDVVLACILGGIDFAFDATITETTGNEDAIDVTDDLGGDLILHGLGIDLDDLYFGIVRGTGVNERFVNRFVSIFVFGVLANDGDTDFVLWVPQGVHQLIPCVESQRLRT